MLASEEQAAIENEADERRRKHSGRKKQPGKSSKTSWARRERLKDSKVDWIVDWALICSMIGVMEAQKHPG